VQRAGPAPPPIVNVEAAGGVGGVGPAGRTGKSSLRYCPGGRRPLSAPRPRPLKPREMTPMHLRLSRRGTRYSDVELRARAGDRALSSVLPHAVLAYGFRRKQAPRGSGPVVGTTARHGCRPSFTV